MKKITLIFIFLLGCVSSSFAQFSENFDADVTLPAGWSVINGGDANTWEIAAPGSGGPSHSGTNVASIGYDSTTAHDDYLITPQFTVNAGVSNHLNLWAQSRSTFFQETFDVLLSTTGTNATDFTEVIATGVAPGTAWQEFSYALSTYEGQSVYVAFKSTTIDQWELYIDDVVIDAAAAAVPECVTNVSPLDGATGVVTGLITFAWADGMGEAATSYDLYYGLTAGNATTLVGNYTTTSADITVTGFNTTFYWKVIAKNSAGEAVGCSEWSFTTQVAPGYCLNGDVYPSTTYTPTTCNGLALNVITDFGYAGEYSNVNVTLGQTYTFNSGTTDFVTISNDLGDTPLAYGPTPVTWVSDRDGVIRFYSHVDDQCTTESVSRTRSVICGIATCTPPTVTFATVSNCPDATFNVTADITNLGTATSITVTDDQSSPSQSVSATGLVTFGPYANGTSVILTVANDQDGSCTVVGTAQTQAACPALNDDIANAEAITCGTLYSGNTSTATLDQANATLYFGVDLDAPNVWYTYTGSGFEETITLNLCGSSYDTSVLVLTGTPGSLTAYAGNDDDNTCGTGHTTNSRVSFTSDGTTTYYIAVEGWNVGSVGAFTMDVTCTGVTPPAVTNQTCASALAVNVDGTDTNSDNSFGDVSATQPTCDNFGSIQDVWFSFVAPTSGSVDVLATAGTMTSLNLSSYSGACGALTSLGCSSNQTTPATQSLTGLTAGATYYVQVWSNAAEQGTFTLKLTDTGLATNNFDAAANFKSYPNPVIDVLNLSYDKNITNVAVFNLLGQEVLTKVINTNQSKIDMSRLASGTYLVKVTADNQVKTIKVIKQ
jgi:hypothetical protein